MARCLVLAFIILFALPGRTHPLDPALLNLQENQSGLFDVVWKTPVSKMVDIPLRATFPEFCKIIEGSAPQLSSIAAFQRFRLDCGTKGLRGGEIKINGLSSWKTDALLRIEFHDGTMVHAVLREGQESFLIPGKQHAWQVAGDYVVMGIEHILFGWDHLLFVFGLVLLVRNWRSLLWTISAFTIGHSVTLSLAALGLVHVPQGWVEILIAGSILVIALELVKARSQNHEFLRDRYPPAVVVVFGLLHGLGFAGVLAEVGLPEKEIPLALLSFNIGIEIGQIFFVLVVLSGLAFCRHWRISWPSFASQAPAYLTGSMASFWIIERATQL